MTRERCKNPEVLLVVGTDFTPLPPGVYAHSFVARSYRNKSTDRFSRVVSRDL